MNVSPEEPFQIIYSLYQFENFGYLFQSYVVQLDRSGMPTLLAQLLSSENIGEFAKGADPTDYELVKLIDSYQRNELLKKFNKKKLPAADFFTRLLDPDKGDTQVRDSLTDYLQRINAKILEKAFEKEFYISGKDGNVAWKKMEIMPDPVSVRFYLYRNEENTHYFPTLRYQGQKLEFQYQNALLICEHPAWMLIGTKLYYFGHNLDDGKKLKPFFNRKFIPIPREIEETYLKKFILPLLATHDVRAKGYDLRQEAFDGVVQPVLTITELTPLVTSDMFGNSTRSTEPQIVATLSFRYGAYEFKADQFASPWHVNMSRENGNYILYKIRRDIRLEKQVVLKLKEKGLDLGWGQKAGERDFFIGWLTKNHDWLVENNIEIVQSAKNPQTYYLGKSFFEVSIVDQDGTDWFDVKVIVRFGEFEVPFLKLRKHILQNKKEYVLPNGEIALIPDNWFTDYLELLQLLETDKDKGIKLRKHHLRLVDSLQKDRLASVVMNRRLEGLKNFEEIDDYELPKNFRGSLRPYQKSGYDWLRFLNEYKLGGCLADDMGLGKTIQTLALLQAQKEMGAQLPSLLIMPVSLLYNWATEAEKFTPSLKVLLYTGSNRDKSMQSFAGYDLILTSYGIVRLDIETLKTYKFQYVILDESQAIKNPGSLTTQAVMQLYSNHRLILTGTPLENSVLDLWSQMSFVNPGLLGSKAYFQRNYLTPIEKSRDEEATQRLYATIKPFILRRHKSQVARFLPEKSESVQFTTMTEEQETLYEQTKNKFRNLILEQMDKEGLAKTQIVLLQGLNELRQLANHPQMTNRSYTGESGKFRDVVHKLETALAENHKILVFSSFVKHLALFREKLDQKGISYAYLDGSTLKRAEEVDKFQNKSDVKVFLISIKAGGVGLNLTAADYVFILDPWWNPAVETQAIDRAHRIGQDKAVFIYKFITKNTVEEKILTLQNKKKELANELITSEEGFVKSLTREDVLVLME